MKPNLTPRTALPRGVFLSWDEILQALDIPHSMARAVSTEIAARLLPIELEAQRTSNGFTYRCRRGHYETLLLWSEQFHDGTPEGIAARHAQTEQLRAEYARNLLGLL